MEVRFDDECGLCRRLVAWAEPETPSARFTPLPASQGAASRDDALVVLIDGSTLQAAPAVAAVLRASRRRRWRLLGRLIGCGPLRPFAAWGYRLVAANRQRISARLHRRSSTPPGPDTPCRSVVDPDGSPGVS